MKKIWKIIKNFLKKIRDLLYRNFITEHIIPIKNQVLLESKPEFSDNTYKLYQEMLKNDYQKKYKIIWIVTKDEVNEKFKRDDIEYFNINKKGVFTKLKLQYLVNTSKYIITCNRVFKRKRKNQVIIYLNHGYPLKDTKKLRMNYNYVDGTCTISKFFVEEDSKILNIPKEKFIITGAARNDDLLSKSSNSKKLLGYNNNKMIIWLPTFRVYEDNKRVDSTFEMPLGIPIIYKEEELSKMNEYLKKRKITLVLKPHFASSLDIIKAKDYSNFKILSNQDLANKELTLYNLLNDSDALITDYSSVYYDYLITKKPIALTLDDYEDYKTNTGFAYEYKDIIKGHYVYDIKDFYDFIDSIDLGNDPHKKERETTLKKLKLDTEGNYSKKILNYLKDKYNF